MNVVPMSISPVAFSELRLPPYQRELSRALLKRIDDEWDERLIRPLLVSINTKHIIDGNHTRVALEKRGYTHGNAQHIACKSLEEEMHVFNIANKTRKVLTAYDMHLAWMSIHDPVAKHVDELMNKIYFWSRKNGPWKTLRDIVTDYPNDVDVLIEVVRQYRVSTCHFRNIVFLKSLNVDVAKEFKHSHSDRFSYLSVLRRLMTSQRNNNNSPKVISLSQS